MRRKLPALALLAAAGLPLLAPSSREPGKLAKLERWPEGERTVEWLAAAKRGALGEAVALPLAKVEAAAASAEGFRWCSDEVALVLFGALLMFARPTPTPAASASACAY